MTAPRQMTASRLVPRLFRAAVLLAAVVAATMYLAGTATAYIGQSPYQILLAGPRGVARCDQAVDVTATVVDAKTGAPIRLQVVDWSIGQSASSSDRLTSSNTTTNSQGKTTVTLIFGPAAGSRSVVASAAKAKASISVRCAGGLPATSTDPVGLEPCTLARLLALAMGTGILLRRRARA